MPHQIVGFQLPEIRLVPVLTYQDLRGTFRRVFDAQSDLIGIQQISFSNSIHERTLRGIHTLSLKSNEWKSIECVSGSVFDVAVDMRPGSETYLKWMGVYLDAKSNFSILLPPGFGHGFLTLSANSSLIYRMSVPFNQEEENGLRWDDPLVNIDWPAHPNYISEKDLAWGLLRNE